MTIPSLPPSRFWRTVIAHQHANNPNSTDNTDHHNESDDDDDDALPDTESSRRQFLELLDESTRDHVCLLIFTSALFGLFGGLQRSLSNLVPENALPAIFIKTYAANSLYFIRWDTDREISSIQSTWQYIRRKGLRATWPLATAEIIIYILTLVVMLVQLCLALESLTLRLLSFDIEALILMCLCRHMYVGFHDMGGWMGRWET